MGTAYNFRARDKVVPADESFVGKKKKKRKHRVKILFLRFYFAPFRTSRKTYNTKKRMLKVYSVNRKKAIYKKQHPGI